MFWKQRIRKSVNVFRGICGKASEKSGFLDYLHFLSYYIFTSLSFVRLSLEAQVSNLDTRLQQAESFSNQLQGQLEQAETKAELQVGKMALDLEEAQAHLDEILKERWVHQLQRTRSLRASFVYLLTFLFQRGIASLGSAATSRSTGER